MDFVPNQEQVSALVRWITVLIGGWMVQKGWIDSSQVTLLVGITTAILPLVWSVIQKTQARRLKAIVSIPGVKVVVGPDASATVQDLARDKNQPNIVEE